jgi:hypothetical protein
MRFYHNRPYAGIVWRERASLSVGRGSLDFLAHSSDDATTIRFVLWCGGYYIGLATWGPEDPR